MNKLIKNRIETNLLNFDNYDIDFNKSNNTQNNINRCIQFEKYLQYEMVDMGLPSGTLWCKYNLGATCENKLQSWYGNYYAWGESEEKPIYSYDTYKFDCKKYTEEIPSQYDVITKKLFHIGQGFHIPTSMQFIELINYTPHKWVINYNGITGLNGRLFKAKNENMLFIPAAGFKKDKELIDDGKESFLWTKNGIGEPPWHAWMFSSNIDFTDIDRYSDPLPQNGLPVRAVYNKN